MNISQSSRSIQANKLYAKHSVSRALVSALHNRYHFVVSTSSQSEKRWSSDSDTRTVLASSASIDINTRQDSLEFL